jgi:anti-sigma regulatory factor (Ser/Thr protein kinase)
VSHPRACQKIQRKLVRDFDAGVEARRELERFRDDLDDTDMEIVALLMTELIANSVKHAGPTAGEDVQLELIVTSDRVRVEVRDGGRGFVPARRPPSEGIGLHWGIELVDRLSDRWQVVAGDGVGETSVWFELDRGLARMREQEATG